MPRTARDRAEALALLDGALQYAWLRVSAPKPPGRWLSNGAVYEVIYGGGRVRLELRDEAGIDPRSAPSDLLSVLPGIGMEMLDAWSRGDSDAAGRLPKSSGIPFVTGNNAAVGVRAQARLDNGSVAAVHAVLGQAGGQGGPAYLYWREKWISWTTK